jgi:hypothetical protein
MVTRGRSAAHRALAIWTHREKYQRGSQQNHKRDPGTSIHHEAKSLGKHWNWKLFSFRLREKTRLNRQLKTILTTDTILTATSLETIVIATQTDTVPSSSTQAIPNKN